MLTIMKRWCIIKVLFVLMVVFPLLINTSEKSMAQSEAPIDELGKIVSSVYYNIESDKNITQQTDLSYEVIDYLNNKITVHRYVDKMEGIKIVNLEVNSKLIKSEHIKDVDIYTYCVNRSFNYSDDIKNKTEISSEVIVKYSNGQIIDICDINNYYDYFMREKAQMKNSGDLSYDVVRDSVYNNSNSKEKMKQLISDINNCAEEELIVNSSDQLKLASIETKGATALNKTNIKKWARNNFKKNSPSSGNGTVPYYDFSDIPGNYDCTNFVSHALLAGGARTYKPAGASGISSTGWYYQSLNNRSSSWSGVSNLHHFLTTNSTKGPAGVSATYSSAVGTKGIGDLIQIKISGTWMHSTVITALTTTVDHRNQAKVTGRSGKNKYNNNVNVKTQYPNSPKRVIKSLVTY